ncbi:MAG: glycosyltransferase [Gemmatimonadetes bacterium]|nr:glycosyltransferase [Gemmatimonadota bacterium]
MLVSWLLFALQSLALLVLLKRLAPGRRRRPPVPPLGDAQAPATTVTILVATLNEARRIGPCLEGLTAQGALVREILVVDSRSTDGTRGLVEDAARRDPRIRLLTDDPLPADWVGKVWALQHGLAHATGEWVLGVDADITPDPGLAAGAVAAALEQRFDVASFSPRFTIPTAAEQWLQPALLVTLVYRCGAAGEGTPDPDRVLANGQCFLARRDVLLAHGGYQAAQRSFADDVTLARFLARRGVRVGFLDGSSLYRVRSYSSMGEAWREWGRSLDLKDATTPLRQWADVAFLFLAQALPLPALVALVLLGAQAVGPAWKPLLVVNGLLVAIRLLLLAALRESYDRPGPTFWLSPLADAAAAVRILLSTVRRRRSWRGRAYAELTAA